jgi:DNA-binding transcriptional ArsR family regulator
MSYKTIPWTTTEESTSIRVKKQEVQLKELKKKSKESLPISVARVVKFLNKNKEQTYTNSQIASAIGLSGSAVSGVMDKLEEIGSVKVVKIRKGLTSGISQVYQSYMGSLNKVEKERTAEGAIARIFEVFRRIHKTYTKKELSEITGISKSKISTALSILLVTENIKVVGIEENVLVYQNIRGNKRAVEISTEPDSNYITLGNYIKMNNIKGDSKEIKAKVAEEKGHSRLFYSDKGIVKEYEISYLQKVIGLGEKKAEKNIIEKIKSYIKV